MSDAHSLPPHETGAGFAIPPISRRARRVGWAIALVFFGTVGALTTRSLLGENEAPPAVPARVVVTAPVEFARSYPIERQFVGRVEAPRRSALAFDRSARVIEVKVEEGDRVESGRPLALLDTRELTAERAAWVAAHARAEASLRELERGPRAEDIAAQRAVVDERRAQEELARRTEARLEKALAGNAVNEHEWDRGRLDHEAARAATKVAEAALARLENGTRIEQLEAQRAEVARLAQQLALVDVQLEKSVLTAPFAGEVTVRHVDEGEVVASGTPVIELTETHLLRARVGVAPEFLSRLAIGSTIPLRVRGRTVDGHVARIVDERDPRSRASSVIIEIDEASSRALFPGDLAVVSLEERIDADGFWLPMSALTESVQGLWSCWVARPLDEAAHHPGATHRIERAELMVLHTDDDRVFVRGTLADGERVVTGGAHRVVPGQEVQIETRMASRSRSDPAGRDDLPAVPRDGASDSR